MQTLSDIPELVRCFKYNPPPKAPGKSASQVCHLVMELMEVGITVCSCTAHCMQKCSMCMRHMLAVAFFCALHSCLQIYACTRIYKSYT